MYPYILTLSTRLSRADNTRSPSAHKAAPAAMPRAVHSRVMKAIPIAKPARQGHRGGRWTMDDGRWGKDATRLTPIVHRPSSIVCWVANGFGGLEGAAAHEG